MTALARPTPQTGSPLPGNSPTVIAALRTARAVPRDGEPVIYSTLGTEARAEAERALAELRDAMRPGVPGEFTSLIATMLAAYGAKSADPQATMAGYTIACEGLPAWAVRQAVKAVLQGTASTSPQFLPAPGALAREARAMIRGYAADIGRLVRLLEAKPAPAPRKRVGAPGTAYGRDAHQPAGKASPRQRAYAAIWAALTPAEQLAWAHEGEAALDRAVDAELANVGAGARAVREMIGGQHG